MEKNRNKILIAVIAYNEEKNIRKTLEDLLANNIGYDIVVIDNGSSDGTAGVAQSMNIPVISHCINSGNSMGTVMTYFMYAHKKNYEILCQFDGDGQHIAAELPKIVNPLLNNEADYVIGSRFLEKEGFQSFFFRRIGIKVFAWIDSKIIGHKVTDVTSGFRAYNTTIISFFSNHYKHEIQDTNQLLLLSSFAGAKIKEVPVIMKERENGTSEFHSVNALLFPFKGLINITGCLLQKQQILKLTRK